MEKFGFANHRVLVTGATGFIGHHLCKRLVEEEADLAIFVLDEEKPINFPAAIYKGNIQSLSDIQRAISRFQPEYVFHLAAQPIVDTALRSVLDSLNTNILGSQNVLHACLEIKDKLKSIVFVSTDKVYGNNSFADEFSPLIGVDHPYNASKLCGDILAQLYQISFDLPVAIVRSGNIYGEGDFNFDRIIPYSAKQLIHREPIVLRSDGTYMRDYVYLDDIVDGYLLLAIGEYEGIFNFGSELSYSVNYIVEAMQTISGVSVPVIVANSAKHEIPNQHINWSRVKELGWFPKTLLETGLQRTYEYYKENLK